MTDGSCGAILAAAGTQGDAARQEAPPSLKGTKYCTHFSLDAPNIVDTVAPKAYFRERPDRGTTQSGEKKQKKTNLMLDKTRGEESNRPCSSLKV
jgi:hypothetical protein